MTNTTSKENAALIPEIVEEQDAFFKREIENGGNVERALAKFTARERWESQEAHERFINANGLSLRDLLETMDNEDFGLHIITEKYLYFVNEQVEPMKPNEAREYIEWSARGLLSAEKVARALARAEMLRRIPGVEERFNELADRAIHLDRLETSVKRRAERVVRFGIDNVDAIINDGRGIYPGDILHIVGGEGAGKTTLLLDILTNYVAQGGHALFFSLDMGIDKVETRLLQRIMNCNRRRVHDEIRADSQQYRDARRKLEGKYRGLKIMGGPLDMDGLRAAVLASGADVIALDFVTSPSLRGFENTMKQATAVAYWAKTIAQEWGLTVILLSQMSRNSGRAQSQGDTGGHGMGGAVLEQTTDYEVELIKDAPNFGNDKPRTILTLRKNRNGIGGRSFELSLMVPSMEFSRKADVVELVKKASPKFQINMEAILGR